MREEKKNYNYYNLKFLKYFARNDGGIREREKKENK